MITYRDCTNPDGSFNPDAIEDMDGALAACEDMHYIIQQQSSLIKNLRTGFEYIIRRAKSSLGTQIEHIAPHE